MQNNTKHDWNALKTFYALKFADPAVGVPRQILNVWRAFKGAPNRGCTDSADLDAAGFWQTDNFPYETRNPICNLSGFGFGFEIECERRGGDIPTAVKAISERFSKLFICKRDGSLNCGTEIVTPVFSRDILSGNSLEMCAMADLFEFLAEQKFKVPSTTGGHVHFSDPRLVGETHDFCLFIESILQDAPPYAVKTLFGRAIGASGYATPIASTLKNQRDTIFARLKKVRDTFGKDESLSDRYMFIHTVKDSDGHVEFRLPAGTLNLLKLSARVHFLDACVGEFVRFKNRDWLNMGGAFDRILRKIFKNVKGFKKYYEIRINELKGDEQ